MDAMTVALNLVKDELEKLKIACSKNEITIDHPIKGEPVIDIVVDGVEKMQLNMAFLCQDCFDKLSAADKI